MKRSREGVVVVRGAAGRPEDRAVQGPNSGHVRGGAEEIQWGREAKGGEAGLQTALQKLQRDGEAAASAARWRDRRAPRRPEPRPLCFVKSQRPRAPARGEGSSARLLGFARLKFRLPRPLGRQPRCLVKPGRGPSSTCSPQQHPAWQSLPGWTLAAVCPELACARCLGLQPARARCLGPHTLCVAGRQGLCVAGRGPGVEHIHDARRCHQPCPMPGPAASTLAGLCAPPAPPRPAVCAPAIPATQAPPSPPARRAGARRPRGASGGARLQPPGAHVSPYTRARTHTRTHAHTHTHARTHVAGRQQPWRRAYPA